jgi:molybdenum transport protein
MRAIPVACTRKNVPGTKPISIKAVRAGGATMHRLSLSETLLVFAEHRLFLDEKADTIVSGLKRSEPEKKIVVEVATIEEALVWVRAGADVLQLEKFSVTDVTACLRASTGISNVLLVATGGINVTNAADYATAGADLLVTSAPYAAAPKDVQVIFERLA